MKGFALGLALKQRRNATRKSPIRKFATNCSDEGLTPETSVSLFFTVFKKPTSIFSCFTRYAVADQH